MSAGELVALSDLTMLRNVDANHLIHAVRQLVAVFFGVFAGDLLDVDHRTGLAVRHTQRGVTNFAALLTEDGAQQTLFRSQLGFALRGDLTHQNVAGFDFGADADNATLVEVGHRVFADVRQITGDLLGTQLGFAGVDLVFLDVDGAQGVVLHETLGDDHSILVVIAVPRHEGDEQVLAQSHFTLLGCRAVGQHGAGFHTFAVVDQRHLVVTGGLVGTAELGQLVGAGGAIVVHYTDDIGGNIGHHARLLSQNHITGINGCTPFGTGAHQRALGFDQRHGLALHVGTHQCSVALIVFQERNQGCADGNHLARGNVHVVNGADRHIDRFFLTDSGKGLLLDEVAVLVELLVGLCDDVLGIAVCGHVFDLVGHMAVDDLTVRGLDEAERVDAAEGCQRADKTDVRAFRRLDRAHTAEVGRVHVSHFHGCTVAGQTARTQSG